MSPTMRHESPCITESEQKAHTQCESRASKASPGGRLIVAPGAAFYGKAARALPLRCRRQFIRYPADGPVAQWLEPAAHNGLCTSIQIRTDHKSRIFNYECSWLALRGASLATATPVRGQHHQCCQVQRGKFPPPRPGAASLSWPATNRSQPSVCNRSNCCPSISTSATRLAAAASALAVAL